jgi:coenzyme F420-0:L-glutamate ligase/coenzyme F420-1:gamma-L-glutamate ligase
VAVIISDTFGRPWRAGLTNVAIGVSGLAPVVDYRGQTDPAGMELKMTVVAVADELASAAELVGGKLDRVPVTIVRGYPFQPGEEGAGALIRDPESDLFR